MSIGWVILGTFLQMAFAGFLFMFVAFYGGGLAGFLGKLKLRILDISLFFLPALCVISAGAVIYQYLNGGGIYSYWWYSLPLFVTVIFFIYIKLSS